MTFTAETTRGEVIQARREELLTVKEYAHLVRCDPMTVYRRIWSGRQAGVVRVGPRDIRIDLAAV